MTRKFLVVIIAMIILRIVTEIAGIAKLIESDGLMSHQRMICARAEAYARNLDYAALYLEGRFAGVQIPRAEKGEYGDGCDTDGFTIYRETNSALPEVYPNWVYRELSSRDPIRGN